MSRHVRLFLIRHGETVDNVAQLTAGSRDSELTNHGYQQAARLGQHFASHHVVFTHMFSSHLQRAAITAAKIREAQPSPGEGTESAGPVPDVVQLRLIMEQDFGFYEGKKWGQDGDPSRHRKTPGFIDVESREAMAQRVDAFLDKHLLPIFEDMAFSSPVIAIVSHGRILSVLWKRLLARLPFKSVSFSPDAGLRFPGVSLEHLGGWANTGYLELFMQKATSQQHAEAASPGPFPTSQSAPDEEVEGQAKVDSSLETDTIVTSPAPALEVHEALSAHGPVANASSFLREWLMTIETVNGRDHLKGLKRTGGGVGSSRHDASQKSIDSFFKKRRVE